MDNEDFALGQFTCYIVAIVLFLIATGILFWVKADHRNDVVHDYKAAQKYNNFFLGIAGQVHLKGTKPWTALALDTKQLLDASPAATSGPNSPLLPHSLNEVNVPEDRYSGASHDLNYYPFQGIPSMDTQDRADTQQTCVDCGKFTSDFLQKLTLIKAGQVNTLLIPVPPKPNTKLTTTPFGWGYNKWLLMLATATAILSYLLMLAINEDHPDWDAQHRSPKVVIRILTWPWTIGGIFVIAYMHVHRRRKKSKEEEKERQRLEQNPVYQELLSAKNRLTALYTMPYEAQKKPLVKQAIKDTQELVRELETFPDRLSVRASELLAQHMLVANEDTRTRPQALIEAAEELDRYS
jgi:hypothetical protein